MSIDSLIVLLRDFGFPVLIAILLLLWLRHNAKQSEKREIRLGKRIDELEDAHSKEMVNLTGQYATLSGQVAEALRELNDTIKRLNRNFDCLVDNLEVRPCLGVEDEPGIIGRHRNLLDRLPRAEDRTGQTTGQEISRETAGRLARRRG